MNDTDHHGVNRPWRRKARWLLADLPLACLMAVALCIVLTLVVLNGRLISVPDQYLGAVRSSLKDAVPGFEVTFQSADIGLDNALHPRVVLRDVALTPIEGDTLLGLKSVDITLDGSSILRGQAKPAAVAFAGGLIEMQRDATGDFNLGMQSGSGSFQANSLADVFDQVEAAFDVPAFDTLTSVLINGLTLRYSDLRARENWTFDGGRFQVSRAADGTSLRMRTDLALLTGAGVPATLAVSYRRDGTQAATLTADLDGVSARDIAGQSPALAWLALVDAPISGSLRTQIDPAKQSPLFATLNFGQGELLPDANENRFKFSQAKTYFTYDPTDARLDIHTLNISSDWGELEAQGYALIRGDEYIVSAVSDVLQIASRGAMRVALPVRTAGVDLRASLDPVRIDIGQAFANIHDSSIHASGVMFDDAGVWRQNIDLTADVLPLSDVLKYWPETTAPKLRGWVTQNITQGTLLDVAAGLRSATGQSPQTYATFGFKDAEFRYMKDLPVVRNGRGHGSVIGKTVDLMLTAGAIDFQDKGMLQVAGSAMHLPDVSIRPNFARFDVKLDGPLSALLTGLDRKPFHVFSRTGRSPDVGSGWATADIAVAMPLRRGLKPDEIIYEASGTVRNFKSNVLVPGQILTAQRLAVRASGQGVSIAGPATIGAVSGDVRWSTIKGVSGSEVSANLRVNDAGLRQFNIKLPAGTLRGATSADVKIVLKPERAPAFNISSNLQGLGISIPALGWRKSADQNGNFMIRGMFAKTPTVERFALQARGLSVDGTLALQNGRLAEAAFSNVTVGNWLQGGVLLSDRGAGRPMAVRLRNATVDLRRSPFGKGGSGPPPPLNGTINRLVISEGLSVTDAQLDLRDGVGPFTGRVNGGARIDGTIGRHEERTIIDITSTNAGRALRDAGLLKQADEGQLTLQLRNQVNGGWRGSAKVIDTRVTDAPAVAALLSAVSVIGILEQLDGKGLMMNEVLADFAIKDDLFTLYSASAVGPSLGLSLDGFINTRTKQLDLQGVLSPFYLVNAVGAIFSRRGEGLIGFNFTLKGPTNDVSVGVNPLSLLTPGLFRDIFRRPPPKVIDE